VAEVGDGGGAELALGALGVEAVLVQNVMRTSLLRIQTTLLKMIYKVLLLAHVLDN